MFVVLTLKIANKGKTLCFQELNVLAKTEEFASVELFTIKEIKWFDGAVSDIFNKRTLYRIINYFFQEKNLLICLSDCEGTFHENHFRDWEWSEAVSCFMLIDEMVNYPH